MEVNWFLATFVRPGLREKNHPFVWDILQIQGPWKKTKLRTAPVQARWCGWSLHTGDMVDFGWSGIAGNEITEQVVL